MQSAIAEPTSRIVQTLAEHIIEIVSDSGEGAQTCGQMFADLCAKNGNGIWTVEIIPAEIEPPTRSRAGASGNRIVLHLVNAMKRLGYKRGIATECIGGGQGGAMLIEAL